MAGQRERVSAKLKCNEDLTIKTSANLLENVDSYVYVNPRYVECRVRVCVCVCVCPTCILALAAYYSPTCLVSSSCLRTEM